MINDMEVRRKVNEFIERHGDFVIKDGWIYHEDGANRDINRLGPLIEPQREPLLLRKSILAYRQGKLTEAVAEFDELKLQLTDSPHADQGLKENVRRLKAQQANVRLWQRQVKEAEELVAQLMPGYRTPKQLQVMADHEAAQAVGRKAIAEITI